MQHEWHFKDILNNVQATLDRQWLLAVKLIKDRKHNKNDLCTIFKWSHQIVIICVRSYSLLPHLICTCVSVQNTEKCIRHETCRSQWCLASLTCWTLCCVMFQSIQAQMIFESSGGKNYQQIMMVCFSVIVCPQRCYVTTYGWLLWCFSFLEPASRLPLLYSIIKKKISFCVL